MNHQLSDSNKVCLLGIDPLTSAISLALTLSGFRGVVFGVDNERVIKDAWGKGLITDGSPSIGDGLAGSDIVILGKSESLPSEVLAFAVDQAIPSAILLDTVASRHRIDRAIAVSSRRDLHFIGFHVEPAANVIEDLASNLKSFFVGKTVLLTPQQPTDKNAVDLLTSIMESAGARVHTMDQDRFDERHAQFDLVSDVLKFLELETILKNCRPEQVVSQHLEGRINQQLDYCSDSRKSEWLRELSDNRAEVIKVLSTIEETVANLRTSILIGSLDEHVASVIQAGRGLLSQATQAKSPALVVNTGEDPRIMQSIATVMAEARVVIERIERLSERGGGFFKLQLQTMDERTRAAAVLRTAGIETELTD